ncbi:MAG: Carboxylesterase NlhH [Chlamydiae bacterium]|nr:Carboxylesterase NlhH [Chlamydiota bacterium]
MLGAMLPFESDPNEIRNLINSKCMAVDAMTYVVHSVEETVIKPTVDRSTALRIYKPSAEGEFPLILFIHGGAWVAGSLDTHDNLARYLCKKTNSVVVSVDYLNSPEGKFPYPLEQCYDALLWVSANYQLLQVVEDCVAVVGDSAGGNMAAALCLMTRDRSGPKISFQALINPAPDLTCKGTIAPTGDKLDILRWQASMYVRSPEEVYNSYVSPILAEDFSNIPPAIVMLAEHDDLYQDGLAFAEKLKNHGVPVNIYCQWGAHHLAADGAKASQQATESLDIVCIALKNAFHKHRKQLALE